MELPPGLRLNFENNPNWDDREFIDEALGEYNAPFLRDASWAYFGIFLRAEANAIRAGLIGDCYAGWLTIRLLWVHRDQRRGGLGSGLIKEAEGFALARSCHSAWVDSFSFQAPDFYRRLGYKVFGTLDYPPDHQRVFLQKRLVAEPT
jgi:GNAT superfamily N-acetyltransferase